MLILGEDDLILKSRLKNETDWEREFNLSIFGEIAEIDMSLKWPFIEMKEITSPPKGRSRKNLHNISKSGSESESPEHKKCKIQEENMQKVHEFVKTLESRKTKFMQSKLSFPKNQVSACMFVTFYLHILWFYDHTRSL